MKTIVIAAITVRRRRHGIAHQRRQPALKLVRESRHHQQKGRASRGNATSSAHPLVTASSECVTSAIAGTKDDAEAQPQHGTEIIDQVETQPLTETGRCMNFDSDSDSARCKSVRRGRSSSRTES